MKPDGIRDFSVIVGLYCLEGMTRGALLALIPLQLLEQFGTTQRVTFIYTLVGFIALGNSILVPFLFEKFGTRQVIAIAGGLPKPAIYVIPDSDPNAFATGSGPEHASIAVTRGLLEKLDRDELQGVVAHELSHVRNYDVRLMTVVAALAGAILLLADWSRRGLWWGGGRSRSSDRGGGSGGAAALFGILWIVSIILAPFVAQIVSLAVSRQREYLADASGAELTRNPLGLASALQKIEDAVEPTPSIKQGIAHLCIADPRGRSLNDREGFFASLFSTHPPIAKRIALLREMGYQR